jgi:hypothetical protein
MAQFGRDLQLYGCTAVARVRPAAAAAAAAVPRNIRHQRRTFDEAHDYTGNDTRNSSSRRRIRRGRTTGIDTEERSVLRPGGVERGLVHGEVNDAITDG